MCGILGYVGKRNGVELVCHGLVDLSYRGYDSWGVAAQTSSLSVHKRTGDISKADFPKILSSRAIGHTRWATHGKVNEKNAHPHTNNEGSIAIVHNGIIENYEDLKLALEDEGYKFVTETDTESIAHLLDHFSKKYEFETAFKKTIDHLKGSYAIVALTKEGRMAFARDGSPLTIGVGEGEHFISSDVTTFLKHTKTILEIKDGEYGFLIDQPRLFRKGKIISREPKKIDFQIKKPEKGFYRHFMLKEIHEQPLALQDTLEQERIEDAIAAIKDASDLYLVGCGTSYNTCAIASHQFSAAKVKAEPVLASQFEKYLPFVNGKTTIVAVSQSGETKDVIDVIRSVKEKGAKVIGIVNVPSSTIAQASDILLDMKAGQEVCVLSTKSCTSQLVIFSLLARALQGKGTDSVRECIACTSHVIQQNTQAAKALASKLKNTTSLFTIGRQALFAVAKEAALKIKEVSYIHAEGFAAGELKHGSIALIEEGTPVIAFSDDKTRDLTTSNAMEVKARGAFVIGVDSKNSSAYDFHIPIPDIEDMTPLLALLPIQLLAYHLALERGCDPDRPRNLAKSVTVR